MGLLEPRLSLDLYALPLTFFFALLFNEEEEAAVVVML